MARHELMRLLHACKADPEDATARLVVADWLEEHGDDARARLVRLQMHRERGGPWWRLSEQDLIERNLEAWLGECRPLFRVSPDVERGFLRAEKTALADAPAALAESEAWAWVEAVDDNGGTDLASPLLATVPILSLTTASIRSHFFRRLPEAAARPRALRLRAIPTDGVDVLLASPFAATVSSLQFRACGLSASSLDRIAALPALRELTLSEASLTGAEGLAPLLPSLRRFALDGYDSTASMLPDLSGATELRQLQLGHHALGDATALDHLGCRDVLERLSLGGCTLDHTSLSRLSFPKLRQVELLRCGLISVGDWPMLHGAESLDLYGNPLGDRFDLPVPGPRFLHLRNCELGDTGAARLAAWKGLEQVEFLEAGANGIGPKGSRALADSPHATRLDALDLSDNPLERDGLAALSPLCSRLRYLRLSGTASPAEVARELAVRPSATLRELDIGYDPSRADVSKLRRVLPLCFVGGTL